MSSFVHSWAPVDERSASAIPFTANAIGQMVDFSIELTRSDHRQSSTTPQLIQFRLHSLIDSIGLYEDIKAHEAGICEAVYTSTEKAERLLAASRQDISLFETPSFSAQSTRWDASLYLRRFDSNSSAIVPEYEGSNSFLKGSITVDDVISDASHNGFEDFINSDNRISYVVILKKFETAGHCYNTEHQKLASDIKSITMFDENGEVIGRDQYQELPALHAVEFQLELRNAGDDGNVLVLDEAGDESGHTSITCSWRMLPLAKAPSSNASESIWSPEGCRTTFLQPNTITCTCSHTTDFVLLYESAPATDTRSGMSSRPTLLSDTLSQELGAGMVLMYALTSFSVTGVSVTISGKIQSTVVRKRNRLKLFALSVAAALRGLGLIFQWNQHKFNMSMDPTDTFNETLSSLSLTLISVLITTLPLVFEFLIFTNTWKLLLTALTSITEVSKPFRLTLIRIQLANFFLAFCMPTLTALSVVLKPLSKRWSLYMIDSAALITIVECVWSTTVFTFVGSSMPRQLIASNSVYVGVAKFLRRQCLATGVLFATKAIVWSVSILHRDFYIRNMQWFLLIFHASTFLSFSPSCLSNGGSSASQQMSSRLQRKNTEPIPVSTDSW